MAFAKIRPKGGTTSQWNTANTVLGERELGFEYNDQGLGKGPVNLKLGDGATAWNDLPYAINMKDILTRLSNLETWKANVEAGTTAVLVETEEEDT